MSPSSSRHSRGDSSATSRSRRTVCSTCSACGDPTKTPRNLIVFIDGTANKFGRNNTNVVKLLESVDCDTKDPLREQYTYYSSGIGTRPGMLHVFQSMQRAISDKLDMAIAWNVEEIVKDAYTWLAGKYQEGDQIYLFGFSRGAYQVRILAGMIYEVGLIKIPTERQVGALVQRIPVLFARLTYNDSAYDLFQSILAHKPNSSDMAREFRMAFSWKDVRVHFIGVWDTVSSVGFSRGEVCLSASSGVAHACHIRHALALDECRVKYMPEYFLEMNSPDLHNPPKHVQLESGDVETGYGDETIKCSIVDSPVTPTGAASETSNGDITLEDRACTTPERPSPCSTRSSDAQHVYQKTADIKEVWFAGSHSDVGGTHRPGEPFHAGNISLMWMRREAYTCGLLLKPGDILWTDEDIDLGTTDSMTFLWKLVEMLPIRHQVLFSGSGKNASRLHLFEPRRIIPGQKIHASVQFANTYIPSATFGNGFGNPLQTAGPILSKEDEVWEKDTIDHTTYIGLFDNLARMQGTAPFYLHRLLFMLRFNEGQWPRKEVSDHRETIADLISKQSGLVRLVAIAVYFEAMDSIELEILPPDIFVEARQSLAASIKLDQPDWPRAVALLRPLAKHKALRDSILTLEAIDNFLKLLDHITSVPGEHFAHVVDALASLVEFCPGPIIAKLAELPDGPHQRDRLSLMLDTNDPRHLTAVLRVLVFLAEKAPRLCRKVKPRLHELAEKWKGPISLLAVQALVQVSQDELHEESVVGSIFSYTSYVSYLHARSANVSPSRNWKRRGDSLLHHLFPAGILGNNHRMFIEKLLSAADGRHTPARTAATFTLLKLCEVNGDLRNYLMDQKVLDTFIKQLQYKDSALLAAYALTKCLAYRKFWKRITRDRLIAGYIVNMIRLDYFDEAVGVVEGFTIFEEIMKCDDLKRKILGYDMAILLERKLGAGKPREMRTSLIYLNILRVYGEHSLTQYLVERGMHYLRTNRWSTQKQGVAILCSLAQTWFGTGALKPIIPEVVNMLLPTHDLENQYCTYASASHQRRSPSSLLGPAFVMRVLADNEALRNEIRQTEEYGRLRHLYLFGDLLQVKETPIWQVRTPTRDDVLDVISQMVKSVDSVQGSTNSGFILPRIEHWDRIARTMRDGVVNAIIIPSAVATVAALVLVGAIVVAPIILSRKVIELAGRPWYLAHQNAIVRSLELSNDSTEELSAARPFESLQDDE